MNETFNFEHMSLLLSYLITFSIYYKTQQIDGLLNMHVELPISIYLECKVETEI